MQCAPQRSHARHRITKKKKGAQLPTSECMSVLRTLKVLAGGHKEQELSMLWSYHEILQIGMQQAFHDDVFASN